MRHNDEAKRRIYEDGRDARQSPRMKLRTSITTCLLFAWMGLATVAQIGPVTGRALLISDIHLDPLADPAIVKQLIAAPLERWDDIFRSSQQKAFAAYRADTNYPLFSSTLAEAAAHEPFDYVVFTGDAVRHNFSKAFAAAGGTSDQFPAFAAKTEAFVIQELQNRLSVGPPVRRETGCWEEVGSLRKASRYFRALPGLAH